MQRPCHTLSCCFVGRIPHCFVGRCTQRPYWWMVVFAVLLMSALYKRRMFRMTLVVSRTLLTLVLAVICIIATVNLISPMQAFAENTLGFGSDLATMMVAVVFAAVLALSYVVMRRLLDAMFTREEEQNKLVKKFTAEVSQTLSTADIMEKLGFAEVGRRKNYYRNPREDALILRKEWNL